MGTGAFPNYQTLGTEGIEIFTNNGTWQDVEIDVDIAFDFTDTTDRPAPR